MGQREVVVRWLRRWVNAVIRKWGRSQQRQWWCEWSAMAWFQELWKRDICERKEAEAEFESCLPIFKGPSQKPYGTCTFTSLTIPSCEGEWNVCPFIATLFSEDSAILNSGHHEVILHVILVQIQLYKFNKFNRSRTYKRCPFAPWGSVYALLQRFFKTQNKVKPKRINSWLLCYQGNKCKTFIDELRDSSRVILSGLNFCFKISS